MNRDRQRSLAALVLAAVLSLPTGAAPAVCPVDESAPRTLILSLDGVAWSAVQQAVERGAFKDWPAPRPLVSTFPSMTNIAFNAIFSPLRHDRIDGYEMRHYDWATNKVFSGFADYAERAGGWRDHYDYMTNSVAAKTRAYLRPRSDILHSLDEIEKLVLETPSDVMVAHIKSTDILAHFRGNDAVAEVLVTVAARLDALAVAHRERHGRDLLFVLLSDHGNTEQKVHFRHGIHERLNEAGLRVRDRLEGPEDIVAPTYGVVSFGVLFTDPSNAELAARAVIDHEGVDLAAWIVEPGTLRVISDEGEALVSWLDRGGRRRLAYEDLGEDPLKLDGVVAELRRGEHVDADGFAAERSWFEHSALADYPDAPRRLVDSLTGTWVRNRATVILSFEPGYAWGQAPVRFGAYVGGGHQEGTHGGLDRGSSLGFFLTSDPDRAPERAVPANEALVDWTDLLACREADGTGAAGTLQP